MKRIPIEKSNRHLLCDDEDYEKLRPFKWYLYRNGNGGRFQLRAWNYEHGNNVSPLGIIYGLQCRAGFTFTFRDGNVCNYQRYNLRWREHEGGMKLISALPVPYCPLGPAILRPKKTEGRSQACFICLEEDYDSYYKCLDSVSHKTYWKGWIRHDA